MESIEQKISNAFKSAKTASENSLVTNLVTLHDIAGKLTKTLDIEELLDITLKCSLTISKADSGSIYLQQGSENDLVMVRYMEMQSPCSSVSAENAKILAEWVVKTGQPLIISGGNIIPEVDIPIDISGKGPVLLAPLKMFDEIVGVVTCCKSKEAEPFSTLDLNMIELLAAQTGIAVNNTALMSSVKQKLEDLSFISAYSEQLMRLVDENEVIKCLFTTVKKHYPVEVIGFLKVQKRNHVFLYWSKAHLTENTLNDLCAGVILEYNNAAKTNVTLKRVSFRQIMPVAEESYEIATPPAYSRIVPVTGEAFDYGAMYFGASDDFTVSNGGMELLSSLANQTRIALTNAKLYGDMKENYIRTIKALAIAVDAKDTYTHGHSENVMNIAEELANEMGLESRRVGIIRDAGLLHDIGKIGVPGNILNKPGTLTYEEFNGVMKTHSALGANIVKDVPFLRDLYTLILYHHENFDGSGYPEGLKAGDIPVGSRIIHVADAFEAMTSNRPYRQSLGKDEAIKRLNESSGKQFDPVVVEAFLRLAIRKGWLNSGVI
ncbi:MAG TPA: hypothetical protein DCO75_12160 [Fibrobacteres bacterium]|jgi:putative nucleotidyltransferase with HDIG domain|nr:hypothetical protein [Fibrobacterota bacterium]